MNPNNDPASGNIVYYGPHLCDLNILGCRAMIVKSGNGHEPIIRLDAPDTPVYPNTIWTIHACPISSTGKYGRPSKDAPSHQSGNFSRANVCGGELPTFTHRHCIFCGAASYPASNQSGICLSENNPTPQDTVGNRYHAYLR